MSLQILFLFHDLAYLCAATGDEIALLSGKKEALADMLTNGKLRLEAHTHSREGNSCSIITGLKHITENRSAV